MEETKVNNQKRKHDSRDTASSPSLSQMKAQSSVSIVFHLSRDSSMIVYKSDHLSFLSQQQVYSSDIVFGHSTTICMSLRVLWRETQIEFTRIPVSTTSKLFFPRENFLSHVSILLSLRWRKYGTQLMGPLQKFK